VDTRAGLDNVEKRKSPLVPRMKRRFLGHPARNVATSPIFRSRRTVVSGSEIFKGVIFNLFFFCFAKYEIYMECC
jgi:hypothetical protein